MYSIGFKIFDVNGTRLTPSRPILDLEEQLGCWFDLSKTPISNQRLIINEQWQGLSDELLERLVKSGKFLSHYVMFIVHININYE